jgi:hypothetical protein
MKSTNPQGNKEINQKRGPTTGNAGSMKKRDTYVAEKSASSSEKSVLANMVTSALEARGRDNRSERRVGVESLHDNTGPKVNPTANGSKLPAKYKR